LGYTRFVTTALPYSINQDWPNKLGLKGVNTGTDNVFPCIEFIASGFSRLGRSELQHPRQASQQRLPVSVTA
jgi:hypothetical protein